MTTRKWTGDPAWFNPSDIDAADTHTWCPNGAFCLRCGATLTQWTKGERASCDEVGNVIGVSHIIYEKVKARVLG